MVVMCPYQEVWINLLIELRRWGVMFFKYSQRIPGGGSLGCFLRLRWNGLKLN